MTNSSQGDFSVEQSPNTDPAPPSLFSLSLFQLQADLLKRPYGDAVFEALQRTIDEEESVVGEGEADTGVAGAGAGTGREPGAAGVKFPPGRVPGSATRSGGGGGVVGGLSAGDKVWRRAATGSGGGSGSEEEEDGRVEGERVEAAARRTALWAVARGVRKELPDGVRVRERGCVLSVACV